ncbi:hypothetical protein RHGRI_014191 [Rhododendron griersonianum]|uniref:Uncharacterized protein n=1 Tax=Rhododendron griersonianum TaxID=479676 RepID=A0AAV6K8X0_9ERIC|nr:hypothetical protein RHGRI_014191 [Rhododendron griersonianum]
MVREEMKRVRDEIYETSIEFPVLEDEVLKGQSILPQLIPSLRTVQKKKAAQASLLDNNVRFLQTIQTPITLLDLGIQNTGNEYHDDLTRVSEGWLRNVATSVLMMLFSWATTPRYRHISSHDVFMLS